jgi:uncharacterized protein (TIGR03083 family)
MPTIVDRDRTVRLLDEEFDAVAAVGGGLTPAQWATPTCLPGWTVQDVLAHLVGTESMLAGDPGPEADVSGLEHLRNDIGRANEVWVASMRPLPGDEVLARFRAVTARRTASLGAMTQADFDRPSWTPAGPDETYGRFMRIRHYDCFLHEHDMRAALDLADREDPDHVDAALAEPEAALGYIVGRRAGMPSGTTVAIAVHGPVERTWRLAVEERARVVDDLPGPATVSLDLPAMLFLRLTGGRVDALPHLGDDLVVGGDETLGRQLATHLAFTI